VDPWGVAESPATAGTEPPPLPPRLAHLATLAGWTEWGGEWAFPQVWELPEVAALERAGWMALDGAPYYALLPAVWPPEHRCWVPDRRPRVMARIDPATGHAITVAPWTAADEDDEDETLAAEAAAIGLPPPPRGRIWLLRSPVPGHGTREVLADLHRRVVERGLPQTATSLTRVARETFCG
jgi:hypothetical protein